MPYGCRAAGCGVNVKLIIITSVDRFALSLDLLVIILL